MKNMVSEMKRSLNGINRLLLITIENYKRKDSELERSKWKRFKQKEGEKKGLKKWSLSNLWNNTKWHIVYV